MLTHFSEAAWVIHATPGPIQHQHPAHDLPTCSSPEGEAFAPTTNMQHPCQYSEVVRRGDHRLVTDIVTMG